MVQRDNVPEGVTDIDLYQTYLGALERADAVSIDDNNGTITIDTDGTELDLVVQDIVDALEQAQNVSTNIDNQPISVDDGTSLTIDTDSTELDLVVQDIIDALEGASYTDSIDGQEHLKARGFGVQPDGDLVGDRAGGQVFADVVTLQP